MTGEQTTDKGFWGRWRGRFQRWPRDALDWIAWDRIKESPIGKFFRRGPAEHVARATASSWELLGRGTWDALGLSFFSTAYHRFRSFGYPHGSYGFAYHKARARGFTHADAAIKAAGGTPPATRLPRIGYIGSGLALATNLHLATQNPYGPFYGLGVSTLTVSAFLPAIRLGWGLGAAIGSSASLWHGLGRGLEMAGAGISRAGASVAAGSAQGRNLAKAMRASRFSGWQTTGKIVGAASVGSQVGGTALSWAGKGISKVAGGLLGRGTIGSLVVRGLTAVGALTDGILGAAVGFMAPIAIEQAATRLPHLGHRLSRRGFGNLYGPYQDTRAALTMRQQAIAAISQSQLNARNALGGEAALIHLT